jgi:hypothetical protein
MSNPPEDRLNGWRHLLLVTAAITASVTVGVLSTPRLRAQVTKYFVDNDENIRQ